MFAREKLMHTAVHTFN